MIGLWPLYYFLLPVYQKIVDCLWKACVGSNWSLWDNVELGGKGCPLADIEPINFVRLAQVIADPTAENIFNLN